MGWPSNESGPDVKLGSKRQGRYRLAGLGKAGRGQSGPKLITNSLKLTVSGSSICRARSPGGFIGRSVDKSRIDHDNRSRLALVAADVSNSW